MPYFGYSTINRGGGRPVVGRPKRDRAKVKASRKAARR